jgi:hypothetical protein
VTTISPNNSRSRAKPVIIQHPPDAPKGVTNNEMKKTAFIQIDVPTPPPTPRPGRLPTPDIPDLEERPFCDCCEGSTRFKYCTSCGCGIERHML